MIVTGTLPGACYAKGMTGFLSARQIRIFDYPRFAEPLKPRVRERAAELASAAGITIEHIAKNHIRKEDVVARVLVFRLRRLRVSFSAWVRRGRRASLSVASMICPPIANHLYARSTA